MSEETYYKVSKSICTFCQTPIKSDMETFFCPSCTSPYHKDCWYENKGCAVYGCGEKHQGEEEFSSLREGIINIEYLINRNQYAEAIHESKQYLKIDRRNIELKNLYNKAVALINNKINLMTSADEAFNKKDYKASEVYYKNVLKYADDIEANFVNTRLEIAKEKIPEQNRRRIYQNVLIVMIILAILAAIGYLGYYTFILKEDRDFSELVQSDHAHDLRSMEQMIGKYETFLRTYSNGRNKARVMSRINQYSTQIASIYYKDDWKLALRYYNKVYTTLSPQDAKNIFNNIYNVAYGDYKQKIANAKKFNLTYNYAEALNELNNAKIIMASFPNESINKETNIVEANISLLNKKLTSLVKSNELERQIREQDKELTSVSSSGAKDLVMISAKVSKVVEKGIYLAKEPGSGNLIAVKSADDIYKAGEYLNLECIYKGKITVEDNDAKEISVPYYVVSNDVRDINGELNTSERDAINQRLRSMRSQKSKLDSLLKQNLL
ncbi:MAG: RING finger protein [bacterium]|nr:RING finger protein [bacterium]